MTTYLLSVSIGPVQEFIAAARRTRDLWFGSYVLSELSKAAANAVARAGGGIQSLVFPAPQDHRDLEPSSPLTVANVILAVISNTSPADVASAARDAVQES